MIGHRHTHAAIYTYIYMIGDRRTHAANIYIYDRHAHTADGERQWAGHLPCIYISEVVATPVSRRRTSLCAGGTAACILRNAETYDI